MGNGASNSLLIARGGSNPGDGLRSFLVAPAPQRLLSTVAFRSNLRFDVSGVRGRMAIELECPECFRVVQVTPENRQCQCGYVFKIANPEFYSDHSATADGIAVEYEIKDFERTNDASGLSVAALQRIAESVLLTTEATLTDYRILKRIEIITAECMYGINLFRDFFTSVTDVIGGRSRASQKVLRDARRTCLLELRREALLVGANAVVGVNLDYSQFTGRGKSMLFLVASGTAVQVEKIEC